MTSNYSSTQGSKARVRRDIYQEVTDRIIAALEEGTTPWVQPWRSIGMSGDLRNGTTGHVYSGINVLLLGMELAANGWSDPRFMTFRQARTAGGSVRKGETGTLITFWKSLVKEGDDGERKAFPMLKHFHVFNVAQCDGVELPEGKTLDELPEPDRDARCERYLDATLADIQHGGNVARYTHAPVDRIQLPHVAAFKDIGAYYATAFHELIHWSGADGRSERTKGKRFGDDAYAFEELVAELGSAFLCQRFSVDGSLQHPEYLRTWLAALKGDKRFLFQAASKARQACEWIDALPSQQIAREAAQAVTGDVVTA